MKKLFLSLLALIVIGVLALGFWPVAPDVPQVGSGGSAGDPSPPANPDRRGAGQVITVEAGGSIQAAVDSARPGDTVRVMPGTYHEEVLISTESLTLEGVVQGEARAVLDGQGSRANGVTAVGDYFTLTGFKLLNYTSNGAQVQGVTGSVFRDLIADKTGDYGIFPILATDVLVEDCVVSGATDTGIYLGQSRNIVVRQNEVFANVSGIEIENSVEALVEDNDSHDNTAGILVFVLPGKTATEGARTKVINNRFEDNNLTNFSRPDMIVHLVPAGTGLLILGADETEVVNNRFSGNKSFAVGIASVTDFPEFFQQEKWDVPVLPENNWIHDNTYENNGYDPDPLLLSVGLQGRDLLWTTTGAGNRWDDQSASRFPPLLPSSAWPGFVRQAYWRGLSFLVKMIT